ncbi:galectin-4 [Agrilus planipennis]|uniref:Galectin n=1 Tax=Agrilus planipennis TaxID=224129 RepID=A0A1W4X9E9_AGRPL|nr:galectin-4 [Agrilus planipennis]
MAQPIYNPPMPFLGPIGGGFSPGKMIRIQGIAPSSGDRFDINLQCGSSIDPRSDIALHLSVRILEGYIPRNNFKDNMWGDEESDGTCPIGAGEHFEIIILSDDNQYKIAVNGQHYTTFAHRLPNSLVSHLDIEGPVQITLISFESTEASHFTQSASSNDAAYSAPPQQYGPPPQQYGPPPQGGYYPSGPYGPSPYGPTAPPGYKEESGFESFLETAGSAIAGALSAGVADKLLGSITGAHSQPQQPPPPPPPQQNYQYGGQGSIGGLGGVGSLLSSLASEVLSPSNKRQGNY